MLFFICMYIFYLSLPYNWFAYIYYGFQFSILIRFLSVQTTESLYLYLIHVLLLGLFPLVVLSYWMCQFLFSLTDILQKSACVLMRDKGWIRIGEEMERNWEEQREEKPYRLYYMRRKKAIFNKGGGNRFPNWEKEVKSVFRYQDLIYKS